MHTPHPTVRTSTLSLPPSPPLYGTTAGNHRELPTKMLLRITLQMKTFNH